MRKKGRLIVRIVLIVLITLFVVYLLGPSPSTPVYSKELPVVPAQPAALEAYISAREAQHKLKPDNEARIIWYDDSARPANSSPLTANGPARPAINSPLTADDPARSANGSPRSPSDSARPANNSPHSRTEYALVYLHGFSASQAEGDPVHRYIAKKYGCNLYLARMAEHGIDTVDAMVNLTADNYWESAKEALAIGRQLGNKVILMGTSTGGTLALQLAATYPDQVAALVLLSPNIAINDPNAWLLNNHWGLQIAHMVTGGNYIEEKRDFGPLYRQYWYPKYRTEAAVALEELLETTMKKSLFEKVTQPVGLFYFYKDPIQQDSTVKVSASLEMFDQLGTPASLKYKEAIPEAGTHVIGSSIRSHDVEGVKKGVVHFMSDILHIPVAAN